MPRKIQFPPFRPRPPWWGGDLQTVRNTVAGRLGLARFELPGETLELTLRDGSGDRLVALLNRAAGPLAVLVHGLTGCATSSYMIATARHLLSHDYSVLRLNMRGAGASARTCAQRYHAGRGEDIADALAALDRGLLDQGIVLAGYSLGGNILVNFLAKQAADFPVRAAALISAPIDLAEVSRRILAPRNFLYHRYLLGRMKFDWAGARLTGDDRRTLAGVRSVYEFDDRLVAPQNGFGTAERYYEECKGMRFLDAIEVPTLVIHAANDPWIPNDAYNAYDWSRNTHLTTLLPAGGGHVGFHAAGSATAWHDRCMAMFFASV